MQHITVPELGAEGMSANGNEASDERAAAQQGRGQMLSDGSFKVCPVPPYPTPLHHGPRSCRLAAAFKRPRWVPLQGGGAWPAAGNHGWPAARLRAQVSTDLGEGETKVWRNPNLPQHLSGGGFSCETTCLEREGNYAWGVIRNVLTSVRACLQAHGLACAMPAVYGRGCQLIALAVAEGLATSSSESDEAEAGVFTTASSR